MDQWDEIFLSKEFKALVRARLRVVIPATIVFIVYYFALPILVGYAPQWMARKVFGAVNVAYLFALSQFFMAWIIAAIYLRAANRFDRMSKKLSEENER